MTAEWFFARNMLWLGQNEIGWGLAFADMGELAMAKRCGVNATLALSSALQHSQRFS